LRVENAGESPSPSGSSTNEEESDQEREVPDEAAYEKQKERANAKAQAKRSSGGEYTSSLATPTTQNVLSSFEGVSSTTPRSDSNGAIGPSQYIEVTNAGFAIYDRSSSTPTSQGTLRALTSQGGNIFDPMVIWDLDTNRFYYTTADTESSIDKRIDFGFSKTSTPSSAADFCQYTISLGSIHADYPRLGDTKDFLLVGTNNSNGSYIGSNLYSITKPPSGSTCPDKSTFTVDQKQR
jgi:hypothetical protein